jgi:hypothetical protein
LSRKSFTKLFGIKQVDDESMRAYLKRFNKKMLKVKELIEPMTFEALMG